MASSRFLLPERADEQQRFENGNDLTVMKAQNKTGNENCHGVSRLLNLHVRY